MIKSVKLVGKYLDQPLLVSKFKRMVPGAFTAGAAVYGLGNVIDAEPEDKKKVAIRDAAVLSATVATALAAPRIAAKVVGKSYEKFAKKDIIAKNTKVVDEFLSKEQVSDKLGSLLEKAKTNILSFKEVKTLHNETFQTENGKKLFNSLIPEPENVTSKDIVSEIGRLSVLGAIPVAGGIAGGLAGEKISDGKLSKEHTANRVKEGAYQYLANIFLCNVGAAAALGVMEKANVKSKAGRVAGMVTGILATGVVGGSMIANYIGKKIVNPIFDRGSDKKLNSERKPEVLDICLHSDDIATIAVMSGLKWMEPALPILYGISGYRAGIGYRNGNKNKNSDNNTVAVA